MKKRQLTYISYYVDETINLYPTNNSKLVFIYTIITANTVIVLISFVNIPTLYNFRVCFIMIAGFYYVIYCDCLILLC